MKIIQTIARVLLGLIYFVFGGMGLGIVLGILSMPEPTGMPEAAMKFMEGITAVGYFFPMLKITETLCGLLLIIGVVAPLALVIIAPVTLNIFLFHAFLTPSPAEMALPGAMLMFQIIAMSGYWHKYKPLFEKKKD